MNINLLGAELNTLPRKTSPRKPSVHRPALAEVAELRAAVLHSYEAGRPDMAAVTSPWVRQTISQSDGGIVDLIDVLAQLLTPADEDLGARARATVADLNALEAQIRGSFDVDLRVGKDLDGWRVDIPGSEGWIPSNARYQGLQMTAYLTGFLAACEVMSQRSGNHEDGKGSVAHRVAGWQG